MTSYSISGFSFNIGSTTISQQYVPLVNEDVPWGINSTYIYKAPTLRDQFNVTNKHLVIENKCLSGNIIFKTQGTEKIIINDLSVGTINGLPYNGSGSGVGLTANSVNSSHIIDGSILGTDISVGTITTSNIADNTITKEKLQGNCIVTSKIADNTIIDLHLQGSCVTNTKIQDGAVTQSKLSTALLDRLTALETTLSRFYTGIFEITNDITGQQGDMSASLKYTFDGTTYFIFENNTIALGSTKFIQYTLPKEFANLTFRFDPGYLLYSYSLNFTAPINGIINPTRLVNEIVFNIQRNSQNYLQLTVLGG